MTTTIEIKGILEERLGILVKSGLYSSKSETVRDSIRPRKKELLVTQLGFRLPQINSFITSL